jgi:hypothetical protein
LNNGYGLEETAFSTVTVKKPMAKPLETQDHCALELFAPELIHESRNCSNVYSLPPDNRSPRQLGREKHGLTVKYVQHRVLIQFLGQNSV